MVSAVSSETTTSYIDFETLMDKYAEKLGEARFHLDRVREDIRTGRKQATTIDLRAFLGSARTVALYVKEEAHAKSGIQEYAVLATREPMLAFFKALRDSDHHHEPHDPPTRFVPSSLKCWDGTAWVDTPLRTWSGSEWVEVPLNVATLVFDGWPFSGSGEVVAASEAYLAALERFLDAAVAARLISRSP